jgi:hypothetical protein
MKVRKVGWLVLSLWPLSAYATEMVDLGTAGSFAVLAGSTVTNTGNTNLFGNLGVWPGTAITGFPPGIVSEGTTDAGNAIAMQAESDLSTAYNSAASAPCGTTLTGQDLGGLTLTPGVYCFGSSAQLTGTLTLDAQGNPNAIFLFQIGSTLTTASGSSVIFANGGQGNDLFWQVGSSATLGTGTDFAGNILALTSITLNTGANIACGSALAQNGAVTMDTNYVYGCGAGVSEASDVPEPGTASLLGIGLLLISISVYKRQSRKHATNPIRAFSERR